MSLKSLCEALWNLVNKFLNTSEKSIPEYIYTYEDYIEDADPNMPIITLEVMYDSPNIEMSQPENEIQESNPGPTSPGVHFLTEQVEESSQENTPNTDAAEVKVRSDLLEYMMRDDGSVICKLCGEILQSRTHWYRHKYKLHVIQPMNPTPLFQCEQCLVFFKSRKGYIGHLASRHSEVLSDSSPVLTNYHAEVAREIAGETVQEAVEETVIHEPDVIPSSSSTCQDTQTTSIRTTARNSESKRPYTRQRDPINDPVEWEQKRSQEEKLVADIIDRVRRECEAQGSGGSTRRGYSRRTTVMNS